MLKRLEKVCVKKTKSTDGLEYYCVYLTNDGRMHEARITKNTYEIYKKKISINKKEF